MNNSAYTIIEELALSTEIIKSPNDWYDKECKFTVYLRSKTRIQMIAIRTSTSKEATEP